MPNAMTPTHVANYFFDQADRHAGLTQLKLQSLCVIAQGWHLALRSKPLFAEPVRARAYGPVVDSLFHEFKRFGAAPMFQARSYAFDLERSALTCPRPDDPQVVDVLERVWEVHKPFTGEDLYETLRGLEAPWHRARQAGWETVPECALESWYAERIRTYLENAGPAKEARK